MGHLEIEAVTIRSATNRDRDKIISLVSDILSEFSLQSDFDTSESDLIDIETTYNKRGGTFNIVENTRKHLLGTFALYPVDKNTCKLRKMYLTKQARGVG
ncbi:MAG: hypothetical protein H7Z37_03890, partial [Pyrinomonadaceae bacterium]|nr:hypothetical protein [Pyrinomonadaceae bacterium]